MAAWFVDRFLAFCEEAATTTTSFYRGFVGMSVAQQRGIAEWTWREINLVNLREHIAPSQAGGDRGAVETAATTRSGRRTPSGQRPGLDRRQAPSR